MKHIFTERKSKKEKLCCILNSEVRPTNISIENHYPQVLTAPTSILTLSISNERKGEHPRFFKIKGSN